MNVMSKIYQPIVIQKTNELIEGLKMDNFFEDYEITNFDFVTEHISNHLTEKFILGKIDDEFEDLFSEEEFEQLLKELVAGSILNELKEKGLVNSIEDENDEELFFLTEKGKKVMKENDDKLI